MEFSLDNVRIKQSISFLLTSHYELIDCVLSNLPDKDLNNASLVCKSWNSTIKNIKKRRTSVEISVVKNREIVGNIFKSCIKSNTLPQLSITFMLYSFYNLYCHYILSNFGINKYKNSLVLNQMRQYMPKTCTNTLFTCSDFYGVNKSGVINLCRGYEILTLTLPEIKGVHIQSINLESESEEVTLPNESIKCALLFGYSANAKTMIQKIGDQITSKQHKDYVFASYILPEYQLKDELNNYNFVKGFIFCGRLKVKKIVISKNENDIKKGILNLKPLSKNSFAFIAPEDQKQSIIPYLEIFHNVFPDIIMVGMDVLEILSKDSSGQIISRSEPRFPVKLPGIFTMYHRPLTSDVEILVFSW